MTPDENYYKVLDFLDKNVKDGNLDSEILKSFKGTIRDNKYVSTYIRSLKEKFSNYKNVNDLIRIINLSELDYELENILGLGYGSKTWQQDPIKIINTIIFAAMEREGKLCDIKDSVNPRTKIGSCELEYHQERVEDNITEYLDEPEQKEYHRIDKNYTGTGQSGYEKFIDKFNPPNQKLSLMLYEDEDIHKFVDNETWYVCDAYVLDIPLIITNVT